MSQTDMEPVIVCLIRAVLFPEWNKAVFTLAKAQPPHSFQLNRWFGTAGVSLPKELKGSTSLNGVASC